VRAGTYQLITEVPRVVGFATAAQLAVLAVSADPLNHPSRRGRYEISGIIEELGALVNEFQLGDEVVCVGPLDIDGGCAEYTCQNVYNVAPKPSPISHEDAAASLAAGLRAYTALHYQLKIIAGETILVLGGASESGHLAVQLASLLGVRVLASAGSAEEINYLEDLNVKIARVIDSKSTSLLEAVMEETGGLGVDAILDARCVMSPAGLENEADVMINCLAVHGRWAHSNPNLQLDPADSERMFFKSITCSFIFEQSWVLSAGQQGRYMHILADIMSKVRQDEIRPKVQRVMQLERIREAHRVLQGNKVGKVVMKI